MKSEDVLQAIKIAVAEVIGTAILMLVGCLGCLEDMGKSVPPGWQPSLTFGFAVLIAVQAIGHVSGAHLNPSVTLGAIILELITVPLGVLYFISQIVGAIIGYSLIMVVTPKNAIPREDFCMTIIRSDITLVQGLAIEIMATSILVFAICGLWDKRNAANVDSAPLRVACVVFVLCVVFGPFTGCSMNPARTLAPAIWNNKWINFWVFLVGPFLGALLASFSYKLVFTPKSCEEEKEAVKEEKSESYGISTSPGISINA